MTDTSGLYELFSRSVVRCPRRIAIEEAEGTAISYVELDVLVGRLAGWLNSEGVGHGDRVGICIPKSIDSVATILAVLRIGGTYVPLDPLAPSSRNAYILNDCLVKAVVAEHRLAGPLQAELESLDWKPAFLALNGTGGGNALRAALDRHDTNGNSTTQVAAKPNDVAYLLYTSGSTGRPKGVMLSHANAKCFVDWCSDVLQPTPDDRFSSHAPFHFDLSILDLYVPLKHGARVVLFGESLGKEAPRLAQKIAEKQISVWYSAPSILSMLVQQGRLNEYDYHALRIVLFAGEVFPIQYLRAIKAIWSAPRFFNLYGPTETNVCTWHEIPSMIPPERTEAYPIGKVCAHYRARVVDVDGKAVAPNAEGELCIAGQGVMQGYWNLPEQNARVFLFDDEGTRWYRTGDIVQCDQCSDYRFLGRRDRMIKRRGYRVELGEIEAALYRHPLVNEAAVVAIAHDDGSRVRAFLSTKNGERLSIIALKKFCTDQLPLYMVPDTFSFMEVLPKTSTDKINYQALKELN